MPGRQSSTAGGRLTRRQAIGLGVGLVAVPLLSACAGGLSLGASPPKAVTGTVEVWGIPMFPLDKDVGGGIVKELEAAHPGLKIAFSPVDDFDGGKLTVTAAGGAPPDLDSVNGVVPQTLAAGGIAAAYDPYLAKSKAIQKADLWPPLVQEVSFKGSLYGMDYAPDIRIMYIDSDLYSQAGLDAKQPPKTWDEIEANIGKTLRKSGQDITVLGFHPFIGSGVGNLWLVPFWQLGGELLSADGTKVTIATEAGANAWSWLLKVINQQGGWPALKAFANKKDPNEVFTHDGMSHYYATNSERSESFPKYRANMPFGYTTYPLPSNGRRVTFGGVHTFALPRGAKNADGAWLFLETFLSPQNNLRFADRYDRVPVRHRLAHSDAYIKGDPFRTLVGQEMPGRHWLIPAPGAMKMRDDIIGVVTAILDKNVAVQAALEQAQTSIQYKLDQALKGSTER